MKRKILLIDVGNTALKWATLEDPDHPNTIIHNGRGDFKTELYERWKKIGITHVFGCTVAAPEIAFSLTKFFNKEHVVWDWVHSSPCFQGLGYELFNGYKDPRTLGADRWYAAIGALENLRETSLLVVHMGTATTCDSICLERDGYYFRGGRIVPGPALMLQSLTSSISSLKMGALGDYQTFPQLTDSAIATGIVDAQVGLVIRSLEYMRQTGFSVQVMLAGGAAQWIAPYVMEVIPDVRVMHNLVLSGLAAKARISLGVE